MNRPSRLKNGLRKTTSDRHSSAIRLGRPWITSWTNQNPNQRATACGNGLMLSDRQFTTSPPTGFIDAINSYNYAKAKETTFHGSICRMANARTKRC